MKKEHIIQSTISNISEDIETETISPVEIMEVMLERISELDPKINSYITINEKNSLKEAKEAKRMISEGKRKSRIHGIPIAVKDLIDTKEIYTTYGSKIFRTNIPSHDATVITKLKEKGAIIIGKTNLHELAYGFTNENPHYGTSKNPWSIKRIAGGSSGGSAAAVSASLCFGALGTDTGGSIRVPSSFCGVVGLKPTYGRVSRNGVNTLSWSLDHVGPITKTVMDSAILLEAISGHDAKDQTTSRRQTEDYVSNISADLSGIKMGYISEIINNEYIDISVKRKFEDAIKVFEKIGMVVEEISMPWIKHGRTVGGTIIQSEASFHLWPLVENQLESIGTDVRRKLEMGRIITASDYMQSQKIRGLLIEDIDSLFKEYKLLFSPTTPIIAPEIGTSEMFTETGSGIDINVILGTFTTPFNMIGVPTISIPCGFSESNMPIGMQIAGNRFEERLVLNAAYAYENNTLHHLKTPDITAMNS